jgi:hypothetical protein
METDDIFEQDWVPFRIAAVAVEVLDVAEAIAAKRQLVGCDAEAKIAYVECLLAVEGGTGI